MNRFQKTFPALSLLYVLAFLTVVRSETPAALFLASLVLWHAAYVGLTFMADMLSIAIVIAMRVGAGADDMDMVKEMELDE